MDTINNVAATAAKAVWGSNEASKEPVSGASGNVSNGEPYDAGNLDPEGQKKVERKLSGEGHEKDAGTKLSDEVEDKETPAAKEGKEEATPVAGDTTGEQNDTRDPEDAEPVVDPTGPGPRPLGDVAREHGGDAGNLVPEKTEGKSTEEPNDEAEKPESKGTGEQHVKTTGFAADGGDFDAANPGAGKEADRLLDQKGVVRDEKGLSEQPKTEGQTAGADPAGGSTSKSDKPKMSLGDRIKAKFHKR